MRFTWDPVKARMNKKKHGVEFEEAGGVFLDPNALRVFDPDHSESEDRWVLLGLSLKNRVLVVIHIEYERDTIRIISARRANKSEINSYTKRLV